jgi:hypothetical protein
LKRDCEAHLKELRFPRAMAGFASDYPVGRKVQLDQTHTLREISLLDQSSVTLVDSTDAFARCLREAGDHARQRLLALEALAKQCDELAAMDFAFLFNTARDLFATGFNVTERRFRHRLL